MIPFGGWILAIVVTLLWYYWYDASKRKHLRNGLKLLPGPKGLPIVGNMLDLGIHPNKQYTKWAQQYGGMYQVQIARNLMVIISDPKLCKELFSDHLLTGRASAADFEMYDDTPGLGLFSSEGERWEVHRKFLILQLRNFNWTKLEAPIMEEVKEVLQMYKKEVGKPITGIRETLRLAVVNGLWSIMSSERFEQTDPRLLKLANNTTKTINEIMENGILLFAGWLKYIIPDRCHYTALRRVMEENKAFFRKSVEEHKKNLQEGEPKDFIDAYLLEMKKHEGNPSSHFYGEMAERQLASILFDMFLAGSDTTAITTAWTSLYLCKFPHVQEKFHQEISQVVGSTRHVSLADRQNLPYTQALIDEIFRFSSIVPDGVVVRALGNKEFHGYCIPKDAFVQPNLYYIHHDPKLWGDPEAFRPERFLSDDGKYLRNKNLQPFQTGRRKCLGESLARDNVFLFLTNLFQQFSMVFDPNEPEPSFEAEVGFLRAPLSFSVIMSDRMSK